MKRRRRFYIERLEPRVLLSAAYTAIELYKLGLPAGASVVDVAEGFGGLGFLAPVGAAAAGEVVGSSGGQAQLWSGNGSPISLHPSGWSESTAWATDGTEQVGFSQSPTYHAFVWRGSASSAVDLNPAGFSTSEAYGVGGEQQVGHATNLLAQHAFLWNGTAQSAVDLNPTKLDGGFSISDAVGTNGSQQVGNGAVPANFVGADFHALLWSGTADSAIDLNPSGFEASGAIGISPSGNQQVGDAVDTLTGLRHAFLWSGSAASAVDLTPAGLADSEALATNGFEQIGEVLMGGREHALLWSGTAASVIDLQALLPSNLIRSWVESIDSTGNVFGVAFDSSNDVYAVEWVRNGLQPFGTTFDGVAGVALSGVVGSFFDSNANAKLSNFTATINWGDGSTSTGTIAHNTSTNRYDVTGGHTYAVAGTYAISIATKSSAGGSTTINSTADIAAPNPTPNVTGPASVSEGGRYALQLSTADTGRLAIANWVINWGDGSVQQLPGSATSASHIYDDGPASELISAAVTDVKGFSAAVTLPVMVQDVAPTAVFSATPPIAAGAAGTVRFSSVFDPSVADTVAGFRYSFDWDNDGVFEVVNSLVPTAPIPANYLVAPGPHVILGRIADKDGFFTDYTATVQMGTVGSGSAALSATSPIAATLFFSSLPMQRTSGSDVVLGAGDWLEYRVDFGRNGVRRAKMQLSAIAARAGLKVQLRLDDPMGEVVASFSGRAAGPHGQLSRSQNVTGVHDLYLEVVGGEAQVNWFSFVPIVAKHARRHPR